MDHLRLTFLSTPLAALAPDIFHTYGISLVGTTSQLVPPTDGLGRIVCPTGLRPATARDLLVKRDRKSSGSRDQEVGIF